jgi:murein L,D-transpeptidase YafK
VSAGAPARVAPAEREGRAAPPCRRIVYIEVVKSEHRLRAWCEQGASLEMTIALGREPRGPKRVADDLRTPEGLYRVSDPARSSRFHTFLPIDYPSVEDAERAWREGRIGPEQRDRILDAHRRRLTPPADTPLGGAIGFHGEGERWAGDSASLDWTLGCIALSDAEIDYLVARIEVGVPVWIRP